MTGEERIAAAFAGARESGRRAAFMPYVMGGFPDLETSVAIGEACIDAGADLLEVGVPFSDPLADGPVIHAAGTVALAAGVTTAGAIGVAGRLARRVPVVLMCYANLVLARGLEAFGDALVAAGVSGLIVPDLPLEEAPATQEALAARGLALVPLVAPTTPDDRMREIGARARGFLYTVGVVGTTGERERLSEALPGVIARAKAATEVPVAVGFGIGTPAQAAAAAEAGADGVIVASRLIRAATDAADPAAVVGDLVAGFAAALSADGQVV